MFVTCYTTFKQHTSYFIIVPTNNRVSFRLKGNDKMFMIAVVYSVMVRTELYLNSYYDMISKMYSVILHTRQRLTTQVYTHV